MNPYQHFNPLVFIIKIAIASLKNYFDIYLVFILLLKLLEWRGGREDDILG